MKTIDQIISEGGYHTDKEIWGHCYGTQFYDHEFQKFRDQPIRLLEIGVMWGGSVRMWLKYFHKAEIVGVDRHLENADKDLFDTERVRLVEGDAYTKDLADTLGMFDIIIDDGPHDFISQLNAVQLYVPHLNPGGILVIEDVQSPEVFPLLDAGLPEELKPSAVRYDFRYVHGRPDDMLYVVRK